MALAQPAPLPTAYFVSTKIQNSSFSWSILSLAQLVCYAHTLCKTTPSTPFKINQWHCLSLRPHLAVVVPLGDEHEEDDDAEGEEGAERAAERHRQRVRGRGGRDAVLRLHHPAQVRVHLHTGWSVYTGGVFIQVVCLYRWCVYTGGLFIQMFCL